MNLFVAVKVQAVFEGMIQHGEDEKNGVEHGHGEHVKLLMRSSIAGSATGPVPIVSKPSPKKVVIAIVRASRRV